MAYIVVFRIQESENLQFLNKKGPCDCDCVMCDCIYILPFLPPLDCALFSAIIANRNPINPFDFQVATVCECSRELLED